MDASDNIWSTSDKFILGSFNALLLQWPVAWKWLIVEQVGVKFGSQRLYIVTCTWVQLRLC